MFKRARRWVGAGVVGLTCAGLFACASDAPSSSPSAGVTATAVLGAHQARSFRGHHLDGGATDGGSTLNENPVLGDFVLYAERSVALGRNDRVSGGDIGVAAVATSTFGPQLTVGDFSFVNPENDLIAASVQLSNGAFVGDIETSALTNSGAGRLGIVGALPSPMPPPPVAAASATGATNVTVNRFHAQRLTPGAYGALTVNGALFLEPGIFSFTTVTVGDSAFVLTLPAPDDAQPGGTDVRIAGTLATGATARISPLQPDDIWQDGWGPAVPCRRRGAASQLSVSVGGHDGTSGAPTLAATLGPWSSVEALIFAPNGTLSVGDGATLTGAFAGFDVKVGNQANIAYESGLSASAVPQAGTQVLTSYGLPPMSPVVGPVPASTPIEVDIGLPLRNEAALTAIIDQASDPTSATYRQWVSPSDFLATYAPVASDYAQLAAWATAQGFQVATYSNNLGVDITGTAAQIEAAFYVNLVEAERPDGSTFYEPESPALGRPLASRRGARWARRLCCRHQ